MISFLASVWQLNTNEMRHESRTNVSSEVENANLQELVDILTTINDRNEISQQEKDPVV